MYSIISNNSVKRLGHNGWSDKWWNNLYYYRYLIIRGFILLSYLRSESLNIYKSDGCSIYSIIKLFYKYVYQLF